MINPDIIVINVNNIDIILIIRDFINIICIILKPIKHIDAGIKQYKKLIALYFINYINKLKIWP